MRGESVEVSDLKVIPYTKEEPSTFYLPGRILIIREGDTTRLVLA